MVIDSRYIAPDFDLKAICVNEPTISNVSDSSVFLIEPNACALSLNVASLKPVHAVFNP